MTTFRQAYGAHKTHMIVLCQRDHSFAILWLAHNLFIGKTTKDLTMLIATVPTKSAVSVTLSPACVWHTNNYCNIYRQLALIIVQHLNLRRVDVAENSDRFCFYFFRSLEIFSFSQMRFMLHRNDTMTTFVFTFIWNHICIMHRRTHSHNDHCDRMQSNNVFSHLLFMYSSSCIMKNFAYHSALPMALHLIKMKN